MYCSNCGAQLPDGASFCEQCGAQNAAAPGSYGAQYDKNSSPFAADPAANGAAPSDYLLQNVLATIFCCQMVGIVGIVFSAIAITSKKDGNLQNYLANARKAKICFWVTLSTGLFYSGYMWYRLLSEVIAQGHF